jgi:hypothetical protein
MVPVIATELADVIRECHEILQWIGFRTARVRIGHVQGDWKT